jgi:putative transposase
MSPRLRNELAGRIYHVVARGVDRRRIFVDDADFESYTRLLATVVGRQGWFLLCYCLMPNHVHLLIETPRTNLGNGMQWLHGRYARAFNARYERTGHLFETRYKSPPVTSDGGFVRTVGYIVVNPVVAVLSPDACSWRWGSHYVVASSTAPPWLAHSRLEDRLDAITGLSYDHIIEARERDTALSRLPFGVSKKTALL